MLQNKPTILFLASWYPTPLNKSHGIFIRNHALALSRFCNVIVAYAYTEPGATGAALVKNKVSNSFEEWLLAYPKSKVRIPVLSALAKFWRFKTAYKKIISTLLAEQVNIKALQVNTVFPAAISLGLFKKHWPVPHTVLEHWSGYLPEDGNYKGFLVKHYTKKIIASASRIFYVSEKQKEAMLSHGLGGNYELIYNSVDTAIFNGIKRQVPQRPLLLHVSSLDDVQKNVSGILRVIASLQKSNIGFDFVFIGGDEQAIQHFSQRAQELDLKNVIFAGRKTPSEISLYMQRSTALVLFSNYENMPVVVLEALACGLPVISTRTGYLDAMIGEGSGKLIEINNEAALLTALNDLLAGRLKSDSKKMMDYIAAHASAEVVGLQLYNYYSSLPDS